MACAIGDISVESSPGFCDTIAGIMLLYFNVLKAKCVVTSIVVNARGIFCRTNYVAL